MTEDRLWALMAACDACLNLRAPTMGETSGSVVRQLSLGKPVVVSDVGWFSELPDEVALKIPVDEREVETLHAALELLATRPEVRRAMGRQRRSSPGASTISSGSPSSTPRRSSRQPAARRWPSRCCGRSRRPRWRSASTPDAPEAAELARRLAEVELGRQS